MAVLPEYPWKDRDGNLHNDLIKHYSNLGLKIQKVGTDEIYDNAVDTYPTDYQYIETDVPVDPEPGIEEANDEEP